MAYFLLGVFFGYTSAYLIFNYSTLALQWVFKVVGRITKSFSKLVYIGWGYKKLQAKDFEVGKIFDVVKEGNFLGRFKVTKVMLRDIEKYENVVPSQHPHRKVWISLQKQRCHVGFGLVINEPEEYKPDITGTSMVESYYTELLNFRKTSDFANLYFKPVKESKKPTGCC